MASFLGENDIFSKRKKMPNTFTGGDNPSLLAAFHFSNLYSNAKQVAAHSFLIKTENAYAGDCGGKIFP